MRKKRKTELSLKIESLIDLIFGSGNRIQALEYMSKNKETLIAEIAAANEEILRKSGTRHHLTEGERAALHLTRKIIGGDSGCAFYALEPLKSPDVTDFRNRGFIKHVLILKIEAGEVKEAWTHLSNGSTIEERLALKAFLYGQLGLKELNRSSYSYYLAPNSVKDIKAKLELAGWREIDPNDDYEYYLRWMYEPRADESEEERITHEGLSAFLELRSAMAVFDQIVYLVKKSSEVLGKYPSKKEPNATPKERKLVRTHLSGKNGSRFLGHLTEYYLSDDDYCRCFVLPSDVEPNITEPGIDEGFIQNVLFLQVDGVEALTYSFLPAAKASEKQQEAILRFLEEEVGLKYLPPKKTLPDGIEIVVGN